MDRSQHDLGRHIELLRRYARALIGSPGDADKLVQDCLTVTLARIRSQGPIEDLQGHLFATLHNIRADDRRKIRRRPEPGWRAPRDTGIPDSSKRTPWLSRPDLESALGLLPEQQRQLVLLVGLVGFDYVRAAQVAGVPIGTAMQRLSRGREALRRLMVGGAAVPARPITFVRTRRISGERAPWNDKRNVEEIDAS